MIKDSFCFWTTMLLFLCFSFSLGANELKQVKFNNTTYLFDSNAISMGVEGKLKKHVEIINKVHSSYSSLLNNSGLSKNTAFNDSVNVSYDQQLRKMQYTNLNQFGIRYLDFDNNDLPRSIHFITPRARIFTEEEEKSRHDNKIPRGYCTISENMAVERTRVLLESIYGTKEAGYFDSVIVGQFNTEYDIEFRIKIKNDICDSRNASATVNANTGYIESYSGERMRAADFNFDYVPKVSKQQVLKMYTDECARLGANIEIYKIHLMIREKKGKRCWAWHIYGDRKDKELITAAMMFIDSETGEVLVKRMD